MLISKKLLTEFNDYFKHLDSIKLTNIFNAIGIEVEQIIKPKTPKGLVVGKILEISKVPKAKKDLNYCTVQTDKAVLKIVCGASNVEVGKYVVVALVGTKFSNDFVIQKRKIL